MLVRIVDGELKKGQKIKLMSTDTTHLVDRVGIFRPKQEMLASLGPGEVGFFTAAIKQVADTRVGDTVTDDKNPVSEALPGFKPAQPVVFCGLFPVDAADFEDLREAVGRLRLNDASFSYEMETSAALGFGFRCGFLGLLHLEIITERLGREFNLDLITTAPSVIYHVHMRDGTMIEMHNPADMPDVMKIAQHGRAVDQGDDPGARRASGLGAEAVPGPARAAEGSDLRGLPRHGRLRAAAQRGGVRLLRPPEVGDQGLCLVRLPDHRLRGGRPRQAVDPGQRRAGRRALDRRAPQPRRSHADAPCARS